MEHFEQVGVGLQGQLAEPLDFPGEPFRARALNVCRWLDQRPERRRRSHVDASGVDVGGVGVQTEP